MFSVNFDSFTLVGSSWSELTVDCDEVGDSVAAAAPEFTSRAGHDDSAINKSQTFYIKLKF